MKNENKRQASEGQNPPTATAFFALADSHLAKHRKPSPQPQPQSQSRPGCTPDTVSHTAPRDLPSAGQNDDACLLRRHTHDQHTRHALWHDLANNQLVLELRYVEDSASRCTWSQAYAVDTGALGRMRIEIATPSLRCVIRCDTSLGSVVTIDYVAYAYELVPAGTAQDFDALDWHPIIYACTPCAQPRRRLELPVRSWNRATFWDNIIAMPLIDARNLYIGLSADGDADAQAVQAIRLSLDETFAHIIARAQTGSTVVGVPTRDIPSDVALPIY